MGAATAPAVIDRWRQECSTAAGTDPDGICGSPDRCDAARACLAEPDIPRRVASVSRAVQRMRRHLADPHCLTDHAQAGMLSPFHFHRVFRMVTAATPGRFLAALRIAEAQRLLIRSSMRVTDIAASVGYASLSSFTNQFTRLVGFNPRAFRSLVDAAGDTPVGVVGRRLVQPVRPGRPALTVTVSGAAGSVLFTGLFNGGIPQGSPAAGAVTVDADVVSVPVPGPGSYELLSVGFDPQSPIAEVLADPQGRRRRVAALPDPVRIAAGGPAGAYHLRLRRPQLTDPPIVVALPLLGVLATGSTRSPRIR